MFFFIFLIVVFQRSCATALSTPRPRMFLLCKSFFYHLLWPHWFMVSYLKLSVFQNFRRLFIAFILLPGVIEIIITMVRWSLLALCAYGRSLDVCVSIGSMQVLLWRNHLWAMSLKDELEVGGLIACISWIFRPSILRKIVELPPVLVIAWHFTHHCDLLRSNPNFSRKWSFSAWMTDRLRLRMT